MKIHHIFFLFAIILISCNNKSKLSVSQDFESLAGWYETYHLSKGKGHSGQYFTRTGPGQEFSQTYMSKVGDITDKTIRRIDMGAWIRIVEKSATARLVLSIESADSTIYWQAIDTESASPKVGEWTRLYFTYDLPPGILPEHVVKMFLWNRSEKVIDADDFDLHFYVK